MHAAFLFVICFYLIDIMPKNDCLNSYSRITVTVTMSNCGIFTCTDDKLYLVNFFPSNSIIKIKL